ncbi:hypothetical protein [Aliikangiella marina]|uniref:hypothetical protein n=1 Tax=Aliikangiella marina TaxID=1712262 RepID=UPI00163DB25B|nr:hypothetical protein [Aliikangiella marina]
MLRVITTLLLLSIVNIAGAADTIDSVLKQYVRPIIPATGLQDPSKPGEYKFKTMEYGQSKTFSFSKPDILTPTISLPDFLADYSRNQKYTDDAYHKFDSSSLGLDAKVWTPIGKGPFPLAFLVHGNSDPGFDYLAELLVSRGYIVAQIDQTYLNGLWGENGARGWILLEHLKLWRNWNREVDSEFYQKVDMERIALIGMSRGGEAVALAAAFNQWQKIPGLDEPTNFNFSIKAVAALAPMDGQYMHAGGANVIKNVNYMVLQGGHDADVYQYLGSRQWQRTHFDDGKDHIKLAIYIYRANHINFNQDMSGAFNFGQRGDFDLHLLSPAQQEHLTKVFVSAFLEDSLFERVEHRALLLHPSTREFGLPEDIYISRYKTSNFDVIEDFESGFDKVSVPTNNSNNPPKPMPIEVVAERLRNGTKTANDVLDIKLEKGVKTHVRFKLSKPSIDKKVKSGHFNLQFSLARADSGEATMNPYNLLSDAKIALLADSTVIHNQALGSAGTVSPLLLSDYSELESDDFKYPVTEPVLQTFSVPIKLENFDERAINIDKDLELDLIFLPNQDVHIILDDIGAF